MILNEVKHNLMLAVFRLSLPCRPKPGCLIIYWEDNMQCSISGGLLLRAVATVNSWSSFLKFCIILICSVGLGFIPYDLIWFDLIWFDFCLYLMAWAAISQRIYYGRHFGLPIVLFGSPALHSLLCFYWFCSVLLDFTMSEGTAAILKTTRGIMVTMIDFLLPCFAILGHFQRLMLIGFILFDFCLALFSLKPRDTRLASQHLGGWDSRTALSMRPALATWAVWGQSELHGKTLSHKAKQAMPIGRGGAHLNPSTWEAQAELSQVWDQPLKSKTLSQGKKYFKKRNEAMLPHSLNEFHFSPSIQGKKTCEQTIQSTCPRGNEHTVSEVTPECAHSNHRFTSP